MTPRWRNVPALFYSSFRPNLPQNKSQNELISLALIISVCGTIDSNLL
ncbi:hypothetical protein COO91_10345 (plasmid) [Nostoc flagelliforme CCNUN1]|uniref:Uncharacterized protein n=1 Tax=Nostoc flagelliforme CCNUN1 TaxID=2038116 RepID=A0A2K8T8V1_9NOSO|nr:hypothetical protein COO91_10345 [Nostoc flagelliforme CCNUN1]